MKAATLTTTVLLIRHGDRYDYHVGKDVWKMRCKSSGIYCLFIIFDLCASIDHCCVESAGALRAPSWWTQGRRVACRTDDGARRVRSREGQIIWILLSSCQHLAEPIPDPRMREPRPAALC